MTMRNDEFQNLMQRVRQGSEEAVQEFLDVYGHHVYRAVRRRLNRKLRSKFDSQDFVQMVWASFFENLSTISTFDRPEAVVGFLIRVATNKVIDECRRRLTMKYNVNHEFSLDGSAEWVKRAAATTDPTPSGIAVANEQWHRLIDGQPSRYRRILELRFAGETYENIAEEVNVSEKTVRRVIRRLSQRLET